MINSAEEFVRLRKSEDPSDYLRAAHDDAPLEVWRDIIVRHADMRAWVAHNKTVPVEILEVLACDPSSDVRYCVAMKNKLPAALILLLANDEDGAVRQRIAYNKNTSIDTLRQLASDERPDIAEAAKKKLSEFQL